MSNKNSLSRYFIFLSIVSFLAVFITIVDKSYSRLVEANQKFSPPANTRITNPKLDIQIVKNLESQLYYNSEDITPIPISTTSGSLQVK